MQTQDHEEELSTLLRSAIQSLPVLDDEPYLRMQVTNIGVVDNLLNDLEKNLLHRYFELDKTPLPEAILVSSLSQLWIFGVYELLRTWRQRSRQVLQFVDKLERLTESERKDYILSKKEELQSGSPYLDDKIIPLWRSFERASSDGDFVITVRNAYDSSEVVFRQIEALRIHLAKHEIPKEKNSLSHAPGYGRIDTSNGSIYWQVLLRGGHVDVISRKGIADACRDLQKDKSQYILPRDIQEKVAKVPEVFYGVKNLSLKLADGTEYHDVIVLWDKEISYVEGHESVPFNAKNVVDIIDETAVT